MRTVISFMHNNQVETRNSEKFYQSFLIASISLCRKIIVQLFFNFAHKLTKHHRNSPDLVINCTEMKSSTAEVWYKSPVTTLISLSIIKCFPNCFSFLYIVSDLHIRDSKVNLKVSTVNSQELSVHCLLMTMGFYA